MDATAALAELRRRTPTMVEQLGALVSVESPSEDVAALGRCAGALTDLSGSVLGVAPECIDVDGWPTLRWRFGPEPRVLLVGHHDTVWPIGTIARWPFAVDLEAGTATGPGCFDMKAGIVQALHALSVLDDLDGIELMVTGDEEIGSDRSVALIKESAKAARAAFVLEPSTGGAYKTARKGTATYWFTFEGRAAHAGLEPEKGANALIALSRLVLELDATARPELGTTVTPTVASAGTTTNTVPASATLVVDVRASQTDEARRVDADLRALATSVPGTRLVVTGGINRPPLPASSGAELMERAKRLNEALGFPPLRAVGVGGGSDGNFTADVGCPTLDGMGAVGDGAHAEGEHVVVPAMAERAALLAAMIDDIRA